MPVSWSSRKRPGKAENEDMAFSAGNLAGVLDGATVPPGIQPCCDLGPAWYVRRLAGAVVAAAAEDPQATLPELLRAGIGQVAGAHRRHCSPAARAGSPAIGPSSTVSMLRCDGDRLDYLVLCDSPLVVRAGGDPRVIADERIEHLPLPSRRNIRERFRLGHGYDAGHAELVSQMVREAWSFRNVDGGYWVAADEPDAADRALTGSLTGVTAAALLTDGVSRAVTSLAMYDTWGTLLDELCAAGPSAVIRGVRAAEESDPNGDRHPRVSPYDDATALLWTAGTTGAGLPGTSPDCPG